ncbi:hypothetical protein Ahy_A05g024788 [Arachis hypogaea]|uniref:Reverse transcriptase zinc-binding domain-containing protein n=1 Tax=Arachis hypogaea TaxID=3818 RepID=A0A445D706_ARAHY|nr:hypothetical protein Ahy_A05g024788 [Arachis hypogaea]
MPGPSTANPKGSGNPMEAAKGKEHKSELEEEQMKNTEARDNQVRHLDVAIIDAGGGGTLISLSSQDQVDPLLGTRSRQWDMGKLQRMLPEDIVKKIIAISPPSPWKEADRIAWGASSDGTFSTKSAYQVTMDEQHTQNKNFRLVWNWQGSERIRTFLWLVTHRDT